MNFPDLKPGQDVGRARLTGRGSVRRVTQFFHFAPCFHAGADFLRFFSREDECRSATEAQVLCRPMAAHEPDFRVTVGAEQGVAYFVGDGQTQQCASGNGVLLAEILDQR